MSSFSYSERLSLLNLDSLEMRRLRADLMLCFKIMKGFVAIGCNNIQRMPLNFSNVLLLTVTHGHRYKLVYQTVRMNVRQHFFAVRNIPVKNYHSSNVVEAELISCFKSLLSKENLSKFVNI